MKVADLIDDLETGDRSMEQLKKGDTEPMTPQEFAGSGLADAIGRLSGMMSGGLAQGIGQLAGQQNALNQAYNQSMANQQAQGMQNMWHRPVLYKNAAGI